MDKEQVLNDIFANDPLGLLTVKPRAAYGQNADERLMASFEEINAFVAQHQREPEANFAEVSEYQLSARLKGIREDVVKIRQLKPYDVHQLLAEVENTIVGEPKADYSKSKVIESIDDILSDDSLGLLGDDDDLGLFEMKHVTRIEERDSADFVARRKPCKNFEAYEKQFKQIQEELSNGQRDLVEFNENQLAEGNYFVHNGLLLLLEKTYKLNRDKFGKVDGRTRVIFENGTESSMKLRSLGKNLFINGRAVTNNKINIEQEFEQNFNGISDNDNVTGYIYVLKSLSVDPEIVQINNLYKIGFSTTAVEERIKNAAKEPTYLMAPVQTICTWDCYNMNPHKFEQLIHQFFGNSCLEVDVFDEKGQRHTPREWFVAPLEIIEKAVELIISGDVVNYVYDGEKVKKM